MKVALKQNKKLAFFNVILAATFTVLTQSNHSISAAVIFSSLYAIILAMPDNK